MRVMCCPCSVEVFSRFCRAGDPRPGTRRTSFYHGDRPGTGRGDGPRAGRGDRPGTGRAADRTAVGPSRAKPQDLPVGAAGGRDLVP
ncbi:hypothetical protein EZV63_35915 [Streptomyces sp. VN1]|nr:hypothetical protein EZV63_35915 [Streptomyces sp. VN1]